MQLSFPTLCLALLSASVVMGQATPLAWKLAEGDQLAWTVRQSTNTQIQAAGRKAVHATLEMRVDSTWHVELVRGSEVLLRHRIESVRLKMNTPPGDPVVFDSRDPSTVDSRAAQELAQQMKPLIGLDLDVTMTVAGEVTKVTPRPKPRDKTAPAGSGAAASNHVGNDHRPFGPLSAVDPETLKQIVRGGLPALPRGPVRRRASWQKDRTLDAALGEIVVRRKFTYAGSEGELEKIELRGSLALRPPPPQKGAPQTVLRSQSLSGEFLFDANAGYLVESSTAQSMVTETVSREGRQLVKTQSKIEVDGRRKK